MLTAMTAVENILAGRTDKSNIWDVNTEMDYHEVRSEPAASTTAVAPQAAAESSAELQPAEASASLAEARKG